MAHAACLANMRTHKAFYKHLHGTFSLVENDAKWAELTRADANGFRGLTSFAATEVNLELEHNFVRDGFAQRVTLDEQTAYLVQNSAVVRFTVAPEDAEGMHAPAVFATGDVAVFPPNTLFELVGEERAGAWEAPNGVCPLQPLLIVAATFRNPLEKEWRGSRSFSLLAEDDLLGGRGGGDDSGAGGDGGGGAGASAADAAAAAAVPMPVAAALAATQPVVMSQGTSLEPETLSA